MKCVAILEINISIRMSMKERFIPMSTSTTPSIISTPTSAATAISRRFIGSCFGGGEEQQQEEGPGPSFLPEGQKTSPARATTL